MASLVKNALKSVIEVMRGNFVRMKHGGGRPRRSSAHLKPIEKRNVIIKTCNLCGFTGTKKSVYEHKSTHNDDQRNDREPEPEPVADKAGPCSYPGCDFIGTNEKLYEHYPTHRRERKNPEEIQEDED